MTPETKTLIETVIKAIIGLGGLGFFWWLIQQIISAKGNEGALKAQLSAVKEDNLNLKKKIETLEKENLEQNKALTKHTHLEALVAKYIHQELSDILIHKETSKAFCKKCLYNDTKEIPLEVRTDGWRCRICTTFYANPNYQPPRQSFF